jgi:transcriptional regulator of acetoin/glycerol metabolism
MTQVRDAARRIEDGEAPVVVAGSLGVDRSTLYRHLAKLTD